VVAVRLTHLLSHWALEFASGSRAQGCSSRGYLSPPVAAKHSEKRFAQNLKTMKSLTTSRRIRRQMLIMVSRHLWLRVRALQSVGLLSVQRNFNDGARRAFTRFNSATQLNCRRSVRTAAVPSLSTNVNSRLDHTDVRWLSWLCIN
jgi:hypothetical protein